MKTERTYVVLGMHRSSTTVVSTGLEYSLGPDSMNIHGNGFAEDAEFVTLNDSILTAAGGSWHALPPENQISAVAPQFRDQIKQMISERNEKYQFWGWKDPRTTLTIRHYLPFLIQPHFICCWRDRGEIAKSLMRRGDGLSYIEGKNLAQEYHNRMLRFLSEMYQ